MVFRSRLNIVFYAIVLLLFIAAGEYDSEKDLIKAAEKHFKKEEFFEASPLYSQLVTNYPQNPDYNFRYGACLVYTSDDKSKAVNYLEYAVKNGVVDDRALFYMARAYHLNYQYDKALKYYQDFKSKLKEKEYEDYQIQTFINQVTSGRRLIKDIQQIKVVDKKKMSNDEFFRAYRISDINRKILILPEEFRSKMDKKMDFKSFIVHNPMNQEIYFASYGDKGENGLDIFKIMKFPDGTFSEPVNLGPYINTVSDENYPYLHPSGRILYFASKGHNSIGGYDIFKSELDSFTNLWGKAENIGFALNSPDDDVLFISDKEEKVAYFASSRTNNAKQTTVYKIIQLSDDEDNVLLKGVVVAKGDLNNEAKIEIVKTETGELIGTYKSIKSSGDFLATLPEEESFTVNIELSNGSFLSTSITTPDNREASVVKKEFIIENGAIAVNDQPMFDGDNEVLNVLRAAADLDVNTDQDVAFNDPNVKKKVYKEGSSEKEKSKTDEQIEDKKPASDDDLIASAKAELEAIEEQKKKIKKEIDAAYYVANKKNVKAEILKKELSQLSEDQSIAINPDEVEKIKKRIADKQAELKKMSMEAMASLTLAKNKENNLTKKEKEEELARAYKSALETAESSGNSQKAIQALEDYNNKMDDIKDELNEIDQSSEDIFAKEIAKKKSAKQMFEGEVSTQENEIQALKDEQSQLKSQANNTKDKALKDELILQANELDAEISLAEQEKRVAETKVTQVKAELEALENGVGVISEIESEVQDDNFQAVLTNEQKQSLSSNIEEDRNMLDEKDQKAAELLQKDAETVEELEERNALADALVETKPLEEYQNSKKKVELEQETITALEQEQDLLEISLKNSNNYAEQKKIQEQIDTIEEQKKSSAQKLKKYVAETEQNIEVLEAKSPGQIDVSEKEQLAQINEEATTILESESKSENIQSANNTNTADDEKQEPILSKKEKDRAEEIAIQKVADLDWTAIDEKEKKSFEEQIKVVEELKVLADQTADKQKKKKLLEEANDKELKAYSKVIDSKESALINLLTDAEEAIDQLEAKSAKQFKKSLEELTSNYEKLSKSDGDLEKLKKVQKIVSELEQLKEDANRELPEETIAENMPDQNETSEQSTSEVNQSNNSDNEGEFGKENIKEDNTPKDIAVQTQSPEEVNKNSPSAREQKKSALNESLGMTREESISYGVSPEVVKAKRAARAKEDEVLALLEEAETYKKMAEEEPGKSKKYLRKASKLEEDAAEKRGEIQESYGELNQKEISNNASEITYNIDNQYIDSLYTDTVKDILAISKKLQKAAEKLREQAKEVKNPAEKNELYNQAYEKEAEAIKKQNIILSGRFDEPEEESSVSFVVNTAPKEDNKYTRKADEFRAKARNAEDEGKRLEYLELARKNELAASDQRTENIINEAEEKQGAFNQRIEFVHLAREQSNNNAFANEAYVLEQESDSIYKEALTVLENARSEEDRVKKIEAMQRVSDIILIAKEKQNDAIQKYQESKANPEDESVVLAFGKKKSKQKPQSVAADDAEENQPLAEESTQKDNEESNENDVVQEVEEQELIATQEEETPAEAQTNKEEQQNEAVAQNTPEAVGENQQESVSEKEENTNLNTAGNANVNELKMDQSESDDPLIAVEQKLSKAKAIEDNEAERADKIYELKQKANTAQDKSESALKRVDQLTDPEQIQAQLREAEKYRQEAEKFELEAKTEEEYLNNNMAEARALKQEAEMIKAAQAGTNEPEQEEVNDISETSPEQEPDITEETNTPIPEEEVATELGRENQFTRADISWDDVKLLGDKNSSSQTVNENLDLGENVTYSSSDEIPMDPEMPNGVIYKVQIGAFRKKIDPSIFNGISPIVGESTGQGFTRYTAGTFRGFKSANMAKGRIRNLGFRDAFVVAFYNGKRISMEEAEDAIAKANESEKFVYENIVQDEVDQLKSAGISEEEALASGGSDLSKSQVVQQSGQNTTPITNNLNQRSDVYFTVQVGAFSSPKSQEQLYGIQPLYSFTSPNGIIRYSTGVYKSFSAADERKQQVRSTTGPSDAFVTAYNGQDKISVDQAKKELEGAESSTSGASTTPSNTVQNIEITFKVQIGAYRTEINPSSAPIIKNLTQYGIEFITTDSGFYLYFAGSFNNKTDADNLRAIIRDAGISDAFVIAMQGDQKISVRKALELLGQ